MSGTRFSKNDLKFNLHYPLQGDPARKGVFLLASLLRLDPVDHLCEAVTAVTDADSVWPV